MIADSSVPSAGIILSKFFRFSSCFAIPYALFTVSPGDPICSNSSGLLCAIKSSFRHCSPEPRPMDLAMQKSFFAFHEVVPNLAQPCVNILELVFALLWIVPFLLQHPSSVKSAIDVHSLSVGATSGCYILSR
ncbi:MAG: hypothetical protein WBC89_01885, partial [Dehalococcoidia bacterium]